MGVQKEQLLDDHNQNCGIHGKTGFERFLSMVASLGREYMEVRRAWHMMSAIHNYIANNKDAQGNLVVKDDKTGKSSRSNSSRCTSRSAT